MDNCGHIWIQAKKPTNAYICQFCSKSIRSEEPIPCIHQWASVDHQLGPNYRKKTCARCQKVEVSLIPILN